MERRSEFRAGENSDRCRWNSAFRRDGSWSNRPAKAGTPTGAATCFRWSSAFRRDGAGAADPLERKPQQASQTVVADDKGPTSRGLPKNAPR